jgi:hypothetical protein
MTTVDNPRPLFAYGTLQFDEVLGALLGRIPASVAATLHDHCARHIDGVVWPGLVVEPGATTPGRLLLDLTKDERARIHAYEDDDYDLVDVDVDVDVTSVPSPPAADRRAAVVYLLRGEAADATWTASWFAATTLQGFVADLEA